MSLRQAAQQALEALIPLANANCPNERECLTDEDHERAAEAVEALCAALAEPQTTHWEGCEAVHPECKAKPITAAEMSAWVKDTWEKSQTEAWQKPEHEVKDLSNYEFKTYKTGGAELEAGFYSTDELRDLVKHLDKMNAATERSMRRMK
jgi:hypothetical protein